MKYVYVLEDNRGTESFFEHFDNKKDANDRAKDIYFKNYTDTEEDLNKENLKKVAYDDSNKCYYIKFKVNDESVLAEIEEENIDDVDTILKDDESIKRLIKNLDKKNINLLNVDYDLELDQMENLIK